MRKEIMEKLREIENQYDVKILYAVESGSRGWGFESQDSDYDVRFIYVHRLNWYLSLKEKRDVIELPINDLLDINGWDLKKALFLFKKSNPSLLEWMSSPIVYYEDENFINKMRSMMSVYFNDKSCIYHYLHMARGNYREYLKGPEVKLKKYFYVLRPILACMWTEKFLTQPPMTFEEMMDQLDLDDLLVDEVNKLLEKKRAGDEMDLQKKIPVINAFLEDKILYYESYVSNLKNNENRDYDMLDDFFIETLSNTWKL